MPIRPATEKDVQAVAVIHKQQFSTHFLGQYSTTLLAGLYREFLGETCFLVHETESGIDGFIVGGHAGRIAAARAAFVRRQAWRCAWETLLRPQLWLQGFQRGMAALKPARHHAETVPQEPAGPSCSLLSVAVAGRAVGSGAAAELVREFDRSLLPWTAAYRLSVEKDNARAIRFYEKMGCIRIGQGGGAIEMRKELRGST